MPALIRHAGPGEAKGVQEMAWAVDLMEKGLNPARTSRAATLSWTKGE
ncbi:hypothetical protein [Streptomyces sp. NRRL S-448]